MYSCATQRMWFACYYAVKIRGFQKMSAPHSQKQSKDCPQLNTQTENIVFGLEEVDLLDFTACNEIFFKCFA